MTIAYNGRVPSPHVIGRVANIYEASFPAWQRLPMYTLLQSISSGSRTLWLSDTGAAFAITLALETSGSDVLLEYFAVEPEHRSCGIGGSLLDDLAASIARPVILELESPEYTRNHESIKRVAFYERHDARPVDCVKRYVIPNLSAVEGPPALPMLLYEIGVEGIRSRRGVELRSLLTAIWTKSYGRPSNDPVLGDMLNALEC